ncbi:MAG: hypothetical protein LBL45_04925 [Treponema sp.]|nr:hypothetical protein [Treponema sp.]
MGCIGCPIAQGKNDGVLDRNPKYKAAYFGPLRGMDAVPGNFQNDDQLSQRLDGQYVPDEGKSGSPIYMELGNITDSAFDFNERQFEKGAKSVLGVEFPVGEAFRSMYGFSITVSSNIRRASFRSLSGHRYRANNHYICLINPVPYSHFTLFLQFA